MNLEETLKQPQLNSLLTDIHEPPCKECQYFTPKAVTDKFGNFNGVSLCSAREMYRDFSCFKEML